MTNNFQKAKELIQEGCQPIQVKQETGLSILEVMIIRVMIGLEGHYVPAHTPDDSTALTLSPAETVDLTKRKNGRTRSGRKAEIRDVLRKHYLGGTVPDMRKISEEAGVSGPYVYMIRKEMVETGELPESFKMKRGRPAGPNISREIYDAVRHLREMEYNAEEARAHVGLPLETVNLIFECPSYESFQDKN